MSITSAIILAAVILIVGVRRTLRWAWRTFVVLVFVAATLGLVTIAHAASDTEVWQCRGWLMKNGASQPQAFALTVTPISLSYGKRRLEVHKHTNHGFEARGYDGPIYLEATFDVGSTHALFRAGARDAKAGRPAFTLETICAGQRPVRE